MPESRVRRNGLMPVVRVFRGLWIPVYAKPADIGSKSETLKPKVSSRFSGFLVLEMKISVFFSNPGHVGVAEKYRTVYSEHQKVAKT